MKRIVRFFIAATSTVLVGCHAFQKPYTFSVGELGIEPQGIPATVTVGSPQLYARESLINDRVSEVRLLQQLLKENEDHQFRTRFGTQIDLELTSSAALAASLSAVLAPTPGIGMGAIASAPDRQRMSLSYGGAPHR